MLVRLFAGRAELTTIAPLPLIGPLRITVPPPPPASVTLLFNARALLTVHGPRPVLVIDALGPPKASELPPSVAEPDEALRSTRLVNVNGSATSLVDAHVAEPRLRKTSSAAPVAGGTLPPAQLPGSDQLPPAVPIHVC